MRSNERFTKYFSIAENPYQINFFDIKVNRDTKAFIDPGVLRASENNFSDECKDLITDFFEEFLKSLKDKNETRGLHLLEGLNETNYFHLGLSKEKSQGNSVGKELTQKIWASFKSSKAASSGFLRDIEDSALFIDNIGPDRISDMVCAILREKFAIYTLNICKYYGLEKVLKETKLLCWNNKNWEYKIFLLPHTEYTPVILVPKYLIRRKTITNSTYYQKNYIFPHLRQQLIDSNSELVKIIKTHKGRKEERKTVYNKDLKSKFGSKKENIVDQTDKNKVAYETYKKEIISTPPRIISIEDLARTLNIAIFDPNKLLLDLNTISTDDNKYSKIIDMIINSIFHGSLIFKESLGNNTNSYYINNFKYFFNFIRQRFNKDQIVVFKFNENLSSIIKNQIENSTNKEDVKLIFCRSNPEELYLKNSIVISDKDLIEVIYKYKEGDLFEESGFLMKHIK